MKPRLGPTPKAGRATIVVWFQLDVCAVNGLAIDPG